jgi:hypothetical protein
MALGFNMEGFSEVFHQLELVGTLGIAPDHVGQAEQDLGIQLLATLAVHLAYIMSTMLILTIM